MKKFLSIKISNILKKKNGPTAHNPQEGLKEISEEYCDGVIKNEWQKQK